VVLCGESAFTFVRGRHGATVNRSARLEAYSEAREFLSVDSSFDPALKVELQHRLDHLALNPRENDVAHEATLAREQYAALLQYAHSPRGAAKLERDRRKELEAYTQSQGKRVATSFGRVFTAGRASIPKNRTPSFMLSWMRIAVPPTRTFSRSASGLQPEPRRGVGRRCHQPVSFGSDIRGQAYAQGSASGFAGMRTLDGWRTPVDMPSRAGTWQPSSPGRRWRLDACRHVRL
jgi:hypothetical protein